MAGIVTGTSTISITTSSSQSAYIDVLKEINKYIINILLAFIMLAMGCVVTVEDFKVVLRRPIGAVIGLGCQFILMPLAAFTLAHVMRLEPAFAISMLIVGSSPGGTLSSLQTHLGNGNVCLSIVMTTISTTAALGMLPFNLWLYSRSWTESTGTSIPYSNIAIALVLIIIPVGLGMIIRWKAPKIAPVVTKIGSISGLGLIGVNTIINCLINPDLLSSPWTLWAAALLLPACGYTLGYLFAFLFRQKWRERRTISFETGTQNVGLALALINVTFGESPLFLSLLTYPSIFGVIMVVGAFGLVGLYVLFDRYYTKPEDETDSAGGDDPDEEMETKGVHNPATEDL